MSVGNWALIFENTYRWAREVGLGSYSPAAGASVEILAGSVKLQRPTWTHHTRTPLSPAQAFRRPKSGRTPESGDIFARQAW